MSMPDQVRSLFEIASEMPAEEREALLRLYKHDPELVAQVRGLLGAVAGTSEPTTIERETGEPEAEPVPIMTRAEAPAEPPLEHDPDFDQALARILGAEEKPPTPAQTEGADAIAEVQSELTAASPSEPEFPAASERQPESTPFEQTFPLEFDAEPAAAEVEEPTPEPVAVPISRPAIPRRRDMAVVAESPGNGASWTRSLRKLWLPIALVALLALWGAISAIAARSEANTQKELRAAAEVKVVETAKELTGARSASRSVERQLAESELQRTQAEQRAQSTGGLLRVSQFQLNETRVAAANLLFQLYDVVRDPRTTPAAKQASIEKAVGEIERLARLSSGDVQLNSTLAAAYIRAGDLMSRNIHSGGPATDAVSFYRRGLELNEELAAASHQPLLQAVSNHAGVALAHSRLGNGASAFAAMRTAFGAFAEIPSAQKESLPGRRTRARVFDASCQVTAMHGNLDEAMTVCSDAARYSSDLSVAEEPAVRMYRGNNYSSLAAQAEGKGEFARAMILINASARAFAQCMVDTPEHQDCESGIASVSSYLGAWQEKLATNESDDNYQNAISALRAIAPHSPVRNAVERVRASLHTRYAEFLKRAGRQREAAEQAKESLAILEPKR